MRTKWSWPELSERQNQALRGLYLLTQAREKRARDGGFEGGLKYLYAGASQVAHYVADELPERRQHGNGAKAKSSWSGKVPHARFIGPALRALVQLGLAKELPRLDWDDYQRSATYAITDRGREVAQVLIAQRALPDCPVCGEKPVEAKAQIVTKERVGHFALKSEPGETRLICQHGHHFTEEGEDRGTEMPPDYTIREGELVPPALP